MVQTLEPRERLKASLTELLEQRPLEQLTIAQIASNAQLSRATFYRYYPDKYELANSIYGESIARLDREYQASPADRSLVALTMDYLKANAPLYRRLLAYDGQNSFRRYLKAYLRAYLTRPVPEAERTPRTMRAISFFANGLCDEISDWLSRGCEEDVDLLADQYLGYMPQQLRAYFRWFSLRQ